MRRSLKLITIVFLSILLTACTSRGGDDDVVVVGEPTAGPTSGAGTIVVVTQSPNQVEQRPTNLPVLFEFQLDGFDLEFFYSNKYIFYGTLRVPNNCYQVERIISKTDTRPESVVIDLKTVFRGENCQAAATNKVIYGELGVDRRASFKVFVDGVPAIRLLPTPTPSPTPSVR